jgi:hypothetical protein
MDNRRAAPRATPRRPGEKGRPLKPPPPPAGRAAAARNRPCSAPCQPGTIAGCGSTCAAAQRPAIHGWPGPCTWPTAPPRPAAGSPSPGAPCSTSWSPCWPATATARPSARPPCTRSPAATAPAPTAPWRSWPRWGSSPTTVPACSAAGWTPSSTAWPRGWAAKRAAGPSPCTTAACAPGRAPPIPRGPACAPCGRRCWPGRQSMTTCVRSPATTSSATSPACTATSGTRRSRRCARCSPGRRGPA